MAIYDVTRTISPQIAVWPGDTPYSQRWTMRIDAGGSANVSTLTMSVHTGTHVDAPYHYAEEGEVLADMPLDIHIGPATVVELEVRGEIRPEHFAGVEWGRVERLLIKTHASLRPDEVWEEDFPYLSVAAAELLGRAGVRLFGTDAPSVDQQHSKTLDAHRALFRGNVAILEALQLRDVPPGEYELIALPLKLQLDGSPVRAILRTL
jgi:arylformamidase